jgi:hypothetical protein
MRYFTCLAARLAALLAAAHGASFPAHSWATLPVFLHTSDESRCVWDASDLAIAARFPAVTVEKWQGCRLRGPTQEACSLATASALRALRPNISVVAWYDSLRIYANRTLNPDILDISDQSCVRNAHTPFLEAHRAYLLPNASGLPALESYIHAHVYDHRSPVVRDYWRDACLALLTPSGPARMDGCGADASQQQGSYVLGLAPAVSAAWTAGHVQAVAAATAAVGALGGVLLGKVPAQLGVSTNGILQEGCNGSNATVSALRAAAALAAATGTRLLFECHADSAAEASLAAFLVGAGEDHYWGTGPWVTPAGGFAGAWLPEFERPLGAPLGAAAYDAATATWSRAFASGTAVTFNAATGAGAIHWAGGQ